MSNTPIKKKRVKKEDKLEISAVAVICAILERFEDLEEETGADFTHAKRIILRWSKKYNIFTL